MSRRADLEAKGVKLAVDQRLQLSITDCKMLPPRMPPPPADQREARRQLGSFLRDRRMESRYSREHHERIVDILTQYPILASTKFGSRRRWDRATPFFHMVGAKGVTVETIQRIYELYPQAVSEAREDNYDSYFPLHYACEATAGAEVVKFLLELYPEAVRIFYQNKLPLHFACQKYGTPFETLRLLLQAYPESLTASSITAPFTPLDVAVNECCHPELVRCLLEYQNKKIPTLFRLHSSGDVYLLQDATPFTQSLAYVLPYVQKLEWSLDNWKRQEPHIPAVIESIKKHGNSLKQLSVAFYSFSSIPPSVETLGLVLAGVGSLPSTLDKLHLSCHLDDHKDHNDSTWPSLNVKSLVLEGFSDVLAARLMSTIPDESPLRELKLKNVDLEGASELPTALNWGPLQKLSMESCPLTSVHTMLPILRDMPRLTHLELIYNQEDDDDDDDGSEQSEWSRSTTYDTTNDAAGEEQQLDVTTDIVPILEQGRLQSLTMDGLVVDEPAVCAVLPPSLHTYHVTASGDNNTNALAALFPNNVTLKDVQLQRNNTTDTDNNNNLWIAYHIALNQCGRALLTEEVNAVDLVNLLTCVKSTLQRQSNRTHEEEQKPVVEAHQVYYGLLRRVPGLWSSNASIV